MERLTSTETPINVARMLHELNAVMPADGILVADGGFAAHWAGLLYDTKQAGRGFVPDRGFASIGYGLPGAIGAALAAKGRPVVSLTGDGGFNMSLGDLETARRMGLSFAIVVFNNARFGLREGAAAPDVRGGRLPVLGPRRDQLRQGRRGDGLHRHPRREAGRAGGSFPQGTGSQAAAPSSSTSSSRAIPRACCPPSTTAR